MTRVQCRRDLTRLLAVTQVARSRRVSVSVVARRSSAGDTAPAISIHGRHVEASAQAAQPRTHPCFAINPLTLGLRPPACPQVTQEIEAHVCSTLNVTLGKLKGAEFLEGEGGLQEVDVRLM